MTGRDVPDWVRTIAAARREWWARLDEAERTAARAAIKTYREQRREKARQRIEKMRRILSAYNDGLTSEEIGALIGMGGRSVREFAARRGVTVSRGERRFRQIAFEKREEAALRAFAADFGSTPTEAVQAIVKAALESDAHPARRLLCVRRRRELAAA
jgi:ferritin-like metal-binding protein YciE